MSTNLIVIAFADRETAKDVRNELRGRESEGAIELQEALVVERGQGEIVEVNKGEKPDMETPGPGGILLPLLYGSSLASLLTGAGVGHVVDTLRGHKIDSDFVDDVGESLEPDSSAIFLQVAEGDVEKVVDVLNQYPGRVLKTTLDDEQEEMLRKMLR